jgi:hypothetical protein
MAKQGGDGLQAHPSVASVQSLGDGLSEMSDRSSDRVAGDVVAEAADRVRQAAAWLDRALGALTQDVRSFARRRPGTFLLGALAAGAFAGRLGRALSDSPDDDSRGGSLTAARDSATQTTKAATEGGLVGHRVRGNTIRPGSSQGPGR